MTTTIYSGAAGLALSALACLVSPQAWAGETKVYLNQSYIEEARNAPDFRIDDKTAVLKLVLEGLPARVKVYPTENYFYFYFHHRGIKYAGNIRFDIADRDKGMIHFNYFKDFTQWQRDESGFSADMGKADGVSLVKAGNLAYDLEYKGRKVRFELNDLAGHKPPKGMVLKGETYLGPVFDESGMQFFLIFNETEKTFHFLLDETATVPDQFNPVEGADRTTVGIRTGFAFYADRFADRKILVGVNQFNTSVNNYLDGPFDQLPDNFIVGDTLLKAILAASPEQKGLIDRFGNSPDGETRYLIAPYMQYEDESELTMISDCAAVEKPPVYYSCFSFMEGPGDDEEQMDGAAPDDQEGAPVEEPQKAEPKAKTPAK